MNDQTVTSTAVPLAEETLRALGVPDELHSALGSFRFTDGRPDPDSAGRLWDVLDLMRGVEVFLNAVPGASLAAMREGLRSVGVQTSRQVAVYGRCDSSGLWLTANTETSYGSTFLDLKGDGPTVIECPAQNVSAVDDFWFRYVADLGFAGPDRGRGGKFLFLPPRYDGQVPDGYFTYRCPTFTNWVVLRNLAGMDMLKQTRVYPLAQASNPPGRTSSSSITATPSASTPTTSRSMRRSTRSCRRSPPTPWTPSGQDSWRPSGS